MNVYIDLETLKVLCNEIILMGGVWLSFRHMGKRMFVEAHVQEKEIRIDALTILASYSYSVEALEIYLNEFDDAPTLIFPLESKTQLTAGTTWTFGATVIKVNLGE